MSQFNVYRNKNAATRKQYPYLLNVQNNLFDDLKTVVVIPFIRKKASTQNPIKYLMPVFTIEDSECILLTPQMAGVPKSQLGTIVEDLSQFRSEIIGSIDFIISGI